MADDDQLRAIRDIQAATAQRFAQPGGMAPAAPLSGAGLLQQDMQFLKDNIQSAAPNELGGTTFYGSSDPRVLDSVDRLQRRGVDVRGMYGIPRDSKTDTADPFPRPPAPPRAIPMPDDVIPPSFKAALTPSGRSFGDIQGGMYAQSRMPTEAPKPAASGSGDAVPAPTPALATAPVGVLAAAPRDLAMLNTGQRQGLVRPEAASAAVPNPVAAPMVASVREPLPDVVRGTTRTSYDERGFEKPRLTMAQYVDLYKSVYGTDTQAKTDRYKSDTLLDIAKEEGKNRIEAASLGVRPAATNNAMIVASAINDLKREYNNPATSKGQRAKVLERINRLVELSAGYRPYTLDSGN